jgi:hypothetical protein
MNLFFDMDNTLIGDRGQLRPLVSETLHQLHDDGHTLYVWSGVGIRWKEVQTHGLERIVRDCYHKPLDEPAQQATTYAPDLVIDDVSAIVEEFGGIVVRPYYLENPRDREMERVYRVIQEVLRTGTSSDTGFRPGRRRTREATRIG